MSVDRAGLPTFNQVTPLFRKGEEGLDPMNNGGRRSGVYVVSSLLRA